MILPMHYYSWHRGRLRPSKITTNNPVEIQWFEISPQLCLDFWNQSRVLGAFFFPQAMCLSLVGNHAIKTFFFIKHKVLLRDMIVQPEEYFDFFEFRDGVNY